MANENMRLSNKGRNLISKWEGLRLTAYQDSVGVWTIGYGHTLGVTPGMTITEAQANSFLDEDVANHAIGIFRFVNVQLNQNQFDALVSFHFNLGAYILQNSQLLTYLNSRQWQAAANEMKKYVYAGGEILQGLVNRRNDEASLFLDTNASTTEETKKKEEFLMWVFYQANNNVPVRWFNGEHAYPLAHADERKAINDIYKANTGKDVPVLTHWKDATPYHNRLANVLNRKADF